MKVVPVITYIKAPITWIYLNKTFSGTAFYINNFWSLKLFAKGLLIVYIPDNPLTVVVFSSDKGNFKQGLQFYNNRKVCVKGIVKEYKGKPEIVITDPGEISIQ